MFYKRELEVGVGGIRSLKGTTRFDISKSKNKRNLSKRHFKEDRGDLKGPPTYGKLAAVSMEEYIKMCKRTEIRMK